MLRTIIIATLLVTAPLGAFAIAERTVLQDTQTTSGVTVSDDGRTVDVTDEALPGSTGWFILPVASTTDQIVEIRIWENLTEDRDDDEVEGQALIMDLPGHDPSFHGWVDSPYSPVTVHHEGQTVRCCQSPWALLGDPFDGGDGDDDGGYGPTGHVEAGQTLRVGLAADGWDPGQTLHIRVHGREAPLQVGELATGTTVQAIDLVQEAQENGTSLRFGDRTVAGHHGQAHLAWDTDRTTLFSVDVWADGDAQAKARLELPNGTVVDNGDGRDQGFQASGSSGPGETSLSLTDLESPAWTDELSDPDRSGWVGAVALIAQVDLPGTSLEVHRWPDQPLPAENSVDLDDTLLPSQDGWFLAEIQADGPGYLEIRYDAQTNATGQIKAFAPLILTEVHPLHQVHSQALAAQPVAEASAEGQSVACCQAGEQALGTGWSAGAGGSLGVPIDSDRPVYLGLVAVGWEPSDSFQLRAHGDGANISLAQLQTGTGAQAIDLVDAAYDQGTSVQVFDRENGQAADVERTFAFQDGGLVLTDHWIEGQAQGKLSLALPDGTTADNGDGQDVSGQIHALTGPGEVTLRFTEVQQPQPHVLAGQHDSYLEAWALIADIPVPFHDLLVDVDETR